MGGVPLLPQKLCGAEEQTSAHLPADHVGPLVDQKWKVAITLDPLGIHRIYDRFGGGPDDQRFLQLLAAAVRHDRDFRGEPLHVLGLTGEKTLRNEQREVGVLVPRVLEHLIQGLLHLLPDGIAVGPDDHAPAHRTVVRQLCARDDLVVPGAEVGGAWCECLGISHATGP
jgi:hypothetical protein